MSDLLNSASLVMIPSGYKEDVVYSEVPTNGNGDLSFTRASNGTRVNSSGLVEDCPWNLLDSSNTFSNANWGLSDATVTGSQAGYDGTNNAWKLQSSGGTSTYIVQGSFSTIRTQSIYAKAGTTSKFSIIVGGYGNGMQFDLSNGTIVTNSNSSYFSGSITSVGNGWYYIVVTIQAIAPTYGLLIATQNLGGGGISVGDYVFIQNSQVNLGSTAKPYFPTTDRLNVPRLTYQNGGGGCPSLLLEKQSTNLISYSEQFDNAGWTQYQGGTITANSVTSPDGTQNADTLSVASGQTYSGIYQSVSASSDVYTVSIFAKYNTKRWLFFFDASAIAQGWFDIQNGVLGTIPSGHTGTIENFGNGWYRCTFKKNTAVTPAYFQIGLVDSDGFSSPTSNGSSYIYGAQLEASSYPTSYIPTTSSSATRVADECSKTGISSLIGQTEGVLFVDFEFTAYDFQSKWIAFLGNNITYIGIYAGNSNEIYGEVYNTSGQANITFTPFVVGQRYKMALAYKANDFAFYVNGTQIGTDSSGSVPTVSSFTFNYDTQNGRLGGKVYNQVALFPTRLTNAELASLTTI